LFPKISRGNGRKGENPPKFPLLPQKQQHFRHILLVFDPNAQLRIDHGTALARYRHGPGDYLRMAPPINKLGVSKMRIVTTLAAAASIAALSTTAFAGGMADEVMEAPVVMEEPMAAPAASSISPTYIVVGVLAALLIAAAVAED
jgi:hypothetical protein